MRETHGGNRPIGVNEMMEGHQLGPQEEEDANQVSKAEELV